MDNKPIPIKDAPPIAQALADYISLVSEDRYASGWDHGIEHELYEHMIQERPYWVAGEGVLWALRQFAVHLNGFVGWDAELKGEAFYSHNLWQDRHHAWQAEQQAWREAHATKS